MAAPAPHLVDEILEEIFLRLPTPAALARVSTACPRFHRIITGRRFLRRFRKLHPPPLLGFTQGSRRASRFLPVEAPEPAAPLARTLADAADFTYSFLPECSEEHWAPCDAGDGRVLVEDTSSYVDRDSIKNLAVCDPLSRRYVLLPVIPKEMTAQQDRLVYFESNLAPIGEDEDEASFKVVCTAHYQSKLIAFVFSSVTGEWCIAASTSWSSLGIAEPPRKYLSRSYSVRDRLYRTDLFSDKLLLLDTAIMEFSTVDVLTGYNVQFRNQPDQLGRRRLFMSAIVNGTKGALEMVTLVRDHSRDSFYLYHTTQQNNGESSNEWQFKNVMELPRQSRYCTMGATEGFLFLRAIQVDQLVDNNGQGWSTENYHFFSLEVKTFELKKLCMPEDFNSAHVYFAFPPSLSKPSL